MPENTLGDRGHHLIAMLNATRAAIVTANAEGLVTGWSAAAETLLGWSEAEALGQPMSMIVPPDYREAHEAGMQRFRSTGEKRVIGKTVELPAQCKDGRVLPCEVCLGAWEAEGETQFYGVLRDISDRREVEAQAEAAARSLTVRTEEMERLSFIASHELQEPLRALTGLADVIAEGVCAAEQPMLSMAVGHMKDTAERMSRMVRAMLDLSLVGRSGRSCRVRLDVPAREVLEELKEALQGCGAEVHVDALPELEADPVELLQMWRHIFNNALQHRQTDEPLRCRVSAEEDSQGWRILVEDNGRGIAHVNPSEAFAVFRQFDRDRAEGEGIGLSYVRRVMESLGGWAEIWNRSTSGVCLTLVLPTPGSHSVQA
ncbi:MAG: sensor histidine kinase [Oceanococcaceae bacterium]